MAESKLTITTFPWNLGGDGINETGKTILRESGRSTDLAFLTVMAQKQSDGKLIPLTDINPELTAAFLTCGANGGDIAAYAAAADGEFAINVDGTLIDVTGLDFNTVAVTALQQVEEVINSEANGLFRCEYDLAGDVFSFISTKTGLPASTITVLTAVSGGGGTDISGASFLNGLTSVGVVTDATGEVTGSIPAGLLMNDDIAFALIDAADVTGQHLMIAGAHAGKFIDEAFIILENSLTLDSIIAATGKTIRQHLQDMNIFAQPTDNHQQIQPI